ncbi:pentapeptide repeat-containing protein [Maricaulaceae bacterium EIL42A08]|nr:pentapeptide repeat-containing protein [Maricaulaceae bacterium EIL42A08]
MARGCLNGLGVINDGCPALAAREDSSGRIISRGCPVAAMVVGDHVKAATGEVTGKALIPRGADLYRSKLDGADFRQAVLVRADRDPGLVPAGLNFDEDGDMKGGNVDFRNCSMVGAQLGNAKLKGADFSGANLHGADLSGADIRDANLNGAILTAANLEGAAIDGVTMENVLRDPDAKALARAEDLRSRIEANDTYTHSLGKKGKRGRFDGEDLRPLGDAFHKSGLVGATFKNACGVGLNFRGVILIGASFEGADLRNARFEGADLRGCNFKNCNLNHADFSRSELTAFDGMSGRRFPPNFSGASMHSTNFDEVVLEDDMTLNEVLGLKPAQKVA